MARDGAGVYSLPGAYLATTGGTILATQHNTPLVDLETDMNTARPVVAGGTGATSASGARTNLGLGTIATQAASAVAITGGAIDGATVGSTTPAAGAFTTLTASGNVTFTGGTVDGVAIGGTTPASGAFTDLQFTGQFQLADGGDPTQPDMWWTGAATTGVYKPAATALGFSIAGTGTYRFDANGLMVGSASTASSLVHVLGGGATVDLPSISSATGLIGQNTTSAGADSALSIVSGNTGQVRFNAGDTDSEIDGQLIYDHSQRAWRLYAASTRIVNIVSDGIQVNRNSKVSTEENTFQGQSVFYRNTATGTNVLIGGYSDVGGSETLNFRVRSSGDVANTNNSYGALSDERLKTNIKPAGSVLDRFMQVEFVEFEWRDTGEKARGVIAQQVQPLFPDIVWEDEDGTLGVNYAGLESYASQAMQEYIRKSEDRLAALEAK